MVTLSVSVEEAPSAWRRSGPPRGDDRGSAEPRGDDRGDDRPSWRERQAAMSRDARLDDPEWRKAQEKKEGTLH